MTDIQYDHSHKGLHQALSHNVGCTIARLAPLCSYSLDVSIGFQLSGLP